MKYILSALILGIFFNNSTANGINWPIGSVVAIVIMGRYLKVNQDKHFEEIKRHLGIPPTQDDPENKNLLDIS